MPQPRSFASSLMGGSGNGRGNGGGGFFNIARTRSFIALRFKNTLKVP